MTFEQYVENLINLIFARPELRDKTVLYATDDEGNGYREVCYTPTLGFCRKDGGYDKEFISESNFEDDELDEDERIINAIVIN